MTLLYYDPVFLEHETGQHPENAGRLRAVVDRLEKTQLDKHCQRPNWKPISPERLARVHSLDYAAAVKATCEKGGGRIEADTVVYVKSYEIALRAAGAVCDAVEQVVRGKDKRALCLVRPPGHHALEKKPMGFCLFNNVATAARLATAELELDRLLVVDWDVHHGNGTQDAFWRDPKVGFLSIHRWPFYPGTGDRDETGAGAGQGTTVNLPVAFGTKRAEYKKLFIGELEKFADRVKPQLVLVSAGFDSHRADPIGSLGLESEDFKDLTRAVLDVAETHAEGRIVSVLEGGYNPAALANSVELHLCELLAQKL